MSIDLKTKNEKKWKYQKKILLKVWEAFIQILILHAYTHTYRQTDRQTGRKTTRETEKFSEQPKQKNSCTFDGLLLHYPVRAEIAVRNFQKF